MGRGSFRFNSDAKESPTQLDNGKFISVISNRKLSDDDGSNPIFLKGSLALGDDEEKELGGFLGDMEGRLKKMRERVLRGYNQGDLETIKNKTDDIESKNKVLQEISENKASSQSISIPKHIERRQTVSPKSQDELNYGKILAELSRIEIANENVQFDGNDVLDDLEIMDIHKRALSFLGANDPTWTSISREEDGDNLLYFNNMKMDRISKIVEHLNDGDSQNNTGSVHLKGFTNASSQMTFANFTESSCNSDVLNALFDMLNAPLNSFYLLFILGGRGWGKSLLLHGFANKMASQGAQSLSSIIFNRDLYDNMVKSSGGGFYNRSLELIKPVKIVIFDDFEYFEKAPPSHQKEALKLLVSCIRSNKWCVLSSYYNYDRNNSFWKVFEKTIVSKGKIVSFGEPDTSLKIDLLKRIATENGLEIDEKLYFYFIDESGPNLKELARKFRTIIHFAKLIGKELNVELLGDLLSKKISI